MRVGEVAVDIPTTDPFGDQVDFDPLPPGLILTATAAAVCLAALAALWVAHR